MTPPSEESPDYSRVTCWTTHRYIVANGEAGDGGELLIEIELIVNR